MFGPTRMMDGPVSNPDAKEREDVKSFVLKESQPYLNPLGKGAKTHEVSSESPGQLVGEFVSLNPFCKSRSSLG